MYTTTSETANTNAFCVWPNEAPSNRREPNKYAEKLSHRGLPNSGIRVGTALKDVRVCIGQACFNPASGIRA
jgi:hypothetical protein